MKQIMREHQGYRNNMECCKIAEFKKKIGLNEKLFLSVDLFFVIFIMNQILSEYRV